MSSSSVKDSFKDILVDMSNLKNSRDESVAYSGPTLLWHDYETWGVDPKHDFPCQFAAIRTDLDLNIIENPISYFCQIPNDYVPNPIACVVTGITPQQSLRDGYIEAEFARKIANVMEKSDTCVVGYNSIRFDDEVTRFLRYRNFYDPYEREWKNGNSRWDIIDLVRACYALRPDGINWPLKENGSPSFKLEELTAANGIAHESAHDAVSDVKATIALAQLIKQKQGKLFDFYFSLRNKNTVMQNIDIANHKPFLHVSGMLSASHGCCSWFLPIAMHPSNKNAIVCLDLASDLSLLATMSSDELKELLYTKQDDLPEGTNKPGIKLVHINKAPFVAPAKTLTPEHAARLNIDREACLKNLDYIKSIPSIHSKLFDIFDDEQRPNKELDIDASLYTRGFASSADKKWMAEIKEAEPEQLSVWQDRAPSPEYAQQLMRYRARNYPNTLDQSELDKWQLHRKTRFTTDNKETCLSISECQLEIAELAEKYADDAKKLKLLTTITRYIEEL
ncbi:MAG: exodeoxyribonuclease-1 [Glaciecola sp.]|jgi:exodeoxyribonuclease-1